jgi:hypothetical protein
MRDQLLVPRTARPPSSTAMHSRVDGHEIALTFSLVWIPESAHDPESVGFVETFASAPS